jgi:hypothetical protein
MDRLLSGVYGQLPNIAQRTHTLQIPVDKIRDLIGKAAQPSAELSSRRAPRLMWMIQER